VIEFLFRLKIVLVTEALEKEKGEDVGLIVLACGLASQDVSGTPEP
jgi:hypothetical protein